MLSFPAYYVYIFHMDIEILSEIRDFDTLDKLMQVFKEHFQNKYDFELYIAPCTDEWMKKFEFVFLEFEEPYEKLFDNTFLKKVFPKLYTSIPLTLYVFLGEEKETGLFGQTLAEFAPNLGEGSAFLL